MINPSLFINKFEQWRKALLIGLFITTFFAVLYISLQIKFAFNDCFLEKWNAFQNEDNLGYHSSLSDLLITQSDLPVNIPFVLSQTVPKNDGVEIKLYPLDEIMIDFAFTSNGSNKTIRHSILWFGTDHYAYCRYKRMTLGYNKDSVPGNLTWNLDRPVGINVIDTVNCFNEGTLRYRCIWIGKYNSYITVFSAPIGDDAISLDDFNAIIVTIDRKIRNKIFGF